MPGATYLCGTDDTGCTCKAPKGTPGGMHHDTCPANPVSAMTPEQLEDSRRKVNAALASTRRAAGRAERTDGGTE